ncbi:hypothetical protein, partial [Pseudomonas viridiflava]
LNILNSGCDVRFDSIVSAFGQLEVYEHKEIVEILVSRVLCESDKIYSGSEQLIALYPQEARVKEFALERLMGRNPPIALLASAYRNDLLVQKLIAQSFGSLAAAMRLQI